MIEDPDDRKTLVQDREEEVAHVDDAVIGRALRWSFIAVTAIALAIGIGIWLNQRKPAAGPAKLTAITAPAAAAKVAAEIPEAGFTDITKAAGIEFVHNNGAYGDKLL